MTRREFLAAVGCCAIVCAVFAGLFYTVTN